MEVVIWIGIFVILLFIFGKPVTKNSYQIILQLTPDGQMQMFDML